MNTLHNKTVLLAFSASMIAALCAEADTNAPPGGAASNALPRLSETIVVTARKWREPAAEVPHSMTVLAARDLEAAGVRTVGDAVRSAPNLTMAEFTARRLSFPYVRGIGSGRNAPAVTTCIDGVPQISFATANPEILECERIEFIRGPQGALYGRNTLGGVINIVTRPPGEEFVLRPSLTLGSHRLEDFRLSLNAPVPESRLGLGLSLGQTSRAGYTKNDLTGHSLDDRSAVYGRAQAQWQEAEPWTVRVALYGERARDGGYALGDMAAARKRPRHVSHDFEGKTDLDVLQPTITAMRTGEKAQFTTMTSLQHWRSEDQTDLDAGPADLVRRFNREKQRVWTEEMRIETPADSPMDVGRGAAMRWLAGVFLFHSSYDQDVANEYRPGAVQALGLPLSFAQEDSAALRDLGAGVFGQSTLRLYERVSLSVGLRGDFERREATLESGARPAIYPATRQSPDRDFGQVSPSFGLTCQWTESLSTYASVGKGYKTGGFNPQAPADKTDYGEETSWTWELGTRTRCLDNRIEAGAALFHTEWEDLQLDVPGPTPATFYIDNAGTAFSRGAELDARLRLPARIALFGGLGLLDTRFGTGTESAGVPVGGNDLPFAPRVTWNAGAEGTLPLGAHREGFARMDFSGVGKYYFDAVNRAEENGYTLAALRAGVRSGRWTVEGWVRNLLDEEYLAIALPSPLLPSGYMAESGAPRTFGLTVKASF